MSVHEVQRFLDDCLSDPEILRRYEARPLPDLELAARCAGYGFRAADLAALIGAMEVHVITVRLGEPIDGNSSLWPRMWGRSRLDYVARELHGSLSAETRDQIAAGAAA